MALIVALAIWEVAAGESFAAAGLWFSWFSGCTAMSGTSSARKTVLQAEATFPVCFLLSDEASFIIGQFLMVDGGEPSSNLIVTFRTERMNDDFTIPPYVADMQYTDSYAEIDEILRSPDFRQGSHQHTKMFMGDSIIMLDGDAHFEKRRMLSALFSKGALQHYEMEALVPVIAQVMGDLQNQRGADGLVRADLVVMVRTLLHRITANVTGIDGVNTDERTERLRTCLEKVSEGLTAEWTTLDRDEVIRIGMEHRAAMIEEFFRPSFARRQKLVEDFKAGAIQRADLPTDLFTLLLLHWDADWTEEYIWREATFFAVAATLTTTHNFPHVIAHLTDWFKAHPEDTDKRTDVDFLRLAVHESLRLHQPAPTLLRIALHDVTLSTGRKIAGGESIALLFTPANRDTDSMFGPEGNSFNPYRTVDPDARPWGLTFGSGAHICLGRPLVTGQSQQAGDDNSATYGTIVRMLLSLYRAGIELDPADPAIRISSSYYDSYAKMPVLFRNL